MINLEKPQPGIYENVSFEDYLKIDAKNNSYLGRLGITAAHAQIEEPDTPSKFFGRLTHTRVLEPSEFDKRYIIPPKVDRRTTEGKAEWAEFTEEHGNKEQITQDNYDTVNAINEAILAHPRAKELLVGEIERTVVWEDPESGILCKARPDIISSPHGMLIDLKTTKDASQESFTRAIANLGYNRQAAHYLNGMNAMSPFLFDKYRFIVCEIKKPYRVQVYKMDAEFLALGQTSIKELIQKEIDCIAANEWPHYQTDWQSGDYEIELECPMWAHKRG